MSKKVYIISIIVFIVDNLSKSIVSTYFKLNQSIEIIKDFFYIRYINNTGASFGILEDNRLLLIVISIIAFIILIRYMYSFRYNKFNMCAFGFLLGGVLGNLSDRVIFGYVRDFFDFIIFNYDFPVFNIADIFIVLGVIMLIISVLRGDDSNGNKSSRRK